MGAKLRTIRRRIRSVQSTMKITRAMELIAASRILRAQQRVEQIRAYATRLTEAMEDVARQTGALVHPLLEVREQPKRAAVLVVTSDRGQCGGYNVNVLKEAEQLQQLLREQGKEPVLYVIGRKGVSYYKFRRRKVEQSWTGFSEQPTYAHAAEAARTLVEAFIAGTEDDAAGVDELHLVYTQFKNMVTQVPQARRMAPLEVEYEADTVGTPGGEIEERREAAQQSAGEVKPLYEFEPNADSLFDALLPKYIGARLFAALLEAAASESANRQRAMKAATDNANELIRTLTLEANQARQAQITQEISEIVGGADALVSAGSES
jgi:F-type H+-transporting ATPase subunit gamma